MGTKNLDEAVDQGRRAFLRQSLLGGVATGVLVGCGQAEIPALDEISDEAVPEVPEEETIPEDTDTGSGDSGELPGDTATEEPVEPSFELPTYESLPIDEGFEFGVSAGDIRYDAAVLWCYIDPSVDVALALWHVDENDTWTRVSESLELRANEQAICIMRSPWHFRANGTVMYFMFVTMQESGSQGLQLGGSARRLRPIASNR